ncbi:MAG TPA: PASTA domain-containing protein [Vicinamibacterales bacterium]|nr:PASTA domain-containing protein [Vicinamibacterales bacterium]
MQRKGRVVAMLVLCLAACSALILTPAPARAQTSSPVLDQTVAADGTAASLTTNPFSTTSPGELLVAFAAADGPGAGGQSLTITGAGLTWALTRRVNTRLGTSEIWTATASGLLSNATVTSAESIGGYAQSLTVVTFANAALGAAAAADAANGAPSVSLTTSRANALVYAVGNDWDAAIARTPGTGQVVVHEDLAATGDTFWVQGLVDPVASAGLTVQVNDTVPVTDRWNLAAVEIVPPDAPGFLLVAYNPTQTVGLQDTVTYDMLVSPFGGFTGPLTCTVDAIPAGATGAMEPPGGPPHPGPIALRVTTGAAVAPGTYHPVATCTADGLSASTAVTSIVTAQPDMRVVLEPNSLSLAQGQNGVANFQVQSMNGYAGLVDMSVTGLPAGVSAVFTPSTLTPTALGTLQLAVASTATPGVYPLVVSAAAEGGGLTRQAAFTLTVLQNGGTGEWRQQALGKTPALFYGSIVGDVGNTGRTRVFASGGNGLMYEYAFDGTAWSFTRIPFGVTGDGEMHNGTVGAGRNDGVNRLYIAANLSGRVYEATWANGAWQTQVIATLPGATDVVIGDGRNDGVIRTYVSWEAGASEFTWNGTAWTQVNLGTSEGGEVHCIDIARGRNDGVNRVYTSNDANGQVVEYSWNGSTWTRVLMGTNLDVRNVAFGPGRNDGIVRGYAASADGNVYEYTWTGAAWQNVSIGNAGRGGIKVHANPVKARDDNLYRVYAAADDGGVYEYSWTGTTWQPQKLGAATAYMYGLDEGDGLNKGTTQIYGTSYDGNAYLFEWMSANPPPLVIVPNLVGLQQASVAGVLNGLGLAVGNSSSQPSTTALIGVVVAQSPAAGTQTPQNTPVDIVVSSGVSVPSVVNLTEADATAALSGVNLVASASTAPSPTVPAGSVISQSPEAGTHVSGGSTVAIVVSSGPPPPVNVPDVRNMVLSAAENTIVAGSLTVGTITQQSSATVAAGSVVDQNPAAGTSVPADSPVNLVVSSGPPPVSVPDVVNMTQAAAASAIATAGLAVGTVTSAPSATVPAGSIVSENPGAGSLVPPGSAVNLVVSSGPPAFAVDATAASDGAGSRTITGFSTANPGDLLLAFVGADGPAGGGQGATLAGGGLAWSLVTRVNQQAGTAEIWQATAAGPLSNVSITSTLQSNSYRQSLTLIAFTGATGTGAAAGNNARSGAPGVSLVTTLPESWVYGVGNDWDNAVARTVGAAQTKVREWVDSSTGDTYWVQRTSSSIPAASTTVQLNDTAPTTDRWNFAAVEILVAPGEIVPNVVNLTQADATSAITGAGLVVGTVTTAPSATVPAGSVISQNPAGGTSVAQGSSVALVISSGVAMVDVPNVVNRTQAAATTALTGVGLVVGTVTTASSETVPAGSVISQSPAAGTSVETGSAVDLVVSTGPPQVTVPNVVNSTQAAATSAITGAGLVVGTVTTAPSATVPAGSVISQSPAAGSLANPGSAVNLVVSTGATSEGIVEEAVVSSDGRGTRTAKLTTAGPNRLILAFAASDGPSSGGQTLTVSGAGLSWTLVRRINTRLGTSEIWQAFATATLSSASVSSTQARTGYRQSLTVVAFANATGVGASSTSNGASGGAAASLVTTGSGSLVYGVGNDWDRAVARTLGPAQVKVHERVDTTTGDTYWVQAHAGAVAASGTTVTLNDTAPTADRWNFAIVEIVQ